MRGDWLGLCQGDGMGLQPLYAKQLLTNGIFVLPEGTDRLGTK